MASATCGVGALGGAELAAPHLGAHRPAHRGAGMRLPLRRPARHQVRPSSVVIGPYRSGSAITEQTPRGPPCAQLLAVEPRHQHGLAFATRLGDLLAGGVGDERRTVERDLARPPDLVADPIRRHDRHQVRSGVALHHALPMPRRVPRRVRRLAADRGRVQEHLGAEQRHAARRFGEPLVPADADADRAVPRVPHPESGVARREVVLLGVAGPVGDVALAVRAEHRPVGIDDHDRVEPRLAGPLVEAQRKDDTELGGDSREVLDGRMPVERTGPGEMLGELVLAEVRTLEQFGDQDDRGLLVERHRGPAARRWRCCRRSRPSSPSAARRSRARSCHRR